MHEAHEPHMPVLVLLSIISLAPDLFFDCLRLLEYAKIQDVLQSTLIFLVVFNPQALKEKADAALFLFSFTDRYGSSLIIQLSIDNLNLLGKLKCLSY